MRPLATPPHEKFEGNISREEMSNMCFISDMQIVILKLQADYPLQLADNNIKLGGVPLVKPFSPGTDILNNPANIMSKPLLSTASIFTKLMKPKMK